MKAAACEGTVTNMADSGACLTVVPPYGHLLCADRWRESSLVQRLAAAGVKTIFDGDLAVADFHLSNRSKVLYVSECDIIAGNAYKRKLVRYRNASSSFQKLVLVEKTRLSEQYFPTVQRFVVFDLGLSLLTVGGQTEASQLISQLVQSESRESCFRARSTGRLWDPLVLSMVQQLPGVGRVKALALLKNFSSLQQICNAAPADLEPVVGQSGAQQIHGFFHKTTAGRP